MTLWIKQKTTIEGIKTKTEIFGRMTGLKLNIDKTEIILLGKAYKNNIPRKYRHQIKEEIKSLDITISTDQAKSNTKNYNDILGKMRSTIEKWETRKMSLAGRICIIKRLITSKLIYAMSNLNSPAPEYWKEVNEMLYRFVHNNKNEKIKRNILIGPYETGGYRMIDLEIQCPNY